MKKIAIIVVAYNAEKYLASLLSSLRKLDYPEQDLKIVFVDNGSRDGTLEILQKEKDFILISNEKNLGFAGGSNVGLRWMLENDFDYAVLLNQDMTVGSDWLKELARTASDQSVGIVQSLTLLDPEKICSSGCRLNFLGIGYSGNNGSALKDFQSEKNALSYANGAGMLVKAEVLRQIGLFDEDFFMYHEDTDLSWRARSAGWGVALAEKAVCFHEYEFNRSPLTFFWIEKNRWMFLLKNFSLKTLILVFPALILAEFGMIISSVFSGWFFQKIKSYFWILAHLKDILAKRKQIQKKRKVKDRELKKYLVAGIEFEKVMNPFLKYVLNPCLSVYWFLIRPLI